MTNTSPVEQFGNGQILKIIASITHALPDIGTSDIWQDNISSTEQQTRYCFSEEFIARGYGGYASLITADPNQFNLKAAIAMLVSIASLAFVVSRAFDHIHADGDSAVTPENLSRWMAVPPFAGNVPTYSTVHPFVIEWFNGRGNTQDSVEWFELLPEWKRRVAGLLGAYSVMNISDHYRGRVIDPAADEDEVSKLLATFVVGTMDVGVQVSNGLQS
jgi:hypothetical protein